MGEDEGRKRKGGREEKRDSLHHVLHERILHRLAMSCGCPLEGVLVALGSFPVKSVGLSQRADSVREPGRAWDYPSPSFYSQACMGITVPSVLLILGGRPVQATGWEVLFLRSHLFPLWTWSDPVLVGPLLLGCQR